MDINFLINKINKYNPKTDQTMIRLAYDFAKKAHEGQKRLSGDDYIVHPLETANILTNLKVSDNIIISGLLHDVPEDTKYTLDDIKYNFGDDVANLVGSISKLGIIKYRGIDKYLENLRKMFLAMAKDIRVILIKFADRIHNLDTLQHLPPAKQERIAKESLEIFAQIANRLGITHLQDMIETKAFKYAYPKEHIWITNIITPQFKQTKQRQLAKMLKKIEILLKRNHVSYLQLYGRTKQIYSLYKKILKKNKDINQVFDYIAARIIVNNISECYTVLGLIHQYWKPLSGRIKDYIAQPKPNGYQSLHTTIFDDENNIMEIQIRTNKMHDEAEYGIAAHWLYKEGILNLQDNRYKWLQELTKWQKEIQVDTSFLETLKLDVFQSRIFVFTPTGDVIDLPEDSTPIDFAYHIHTQVGDFCQMAIVNSKPVSLNTTLKNGDIVEIVTNKNRKGPNPDWLSFVKTRTARNAIKAKGKYEWRNILSIFKRK